MEIEIVTPSPHLRPFFVSYAFVKGKIPAKILVPLPNGMPDLVFHFNDAPIFYLSPGENSLQYPCFVTGLITRPGYFLDVEGKTMDCMTVMFTHTGFFYLFGIPQSQLRNTIMPIELVFGNKSVILSEKMAATPSNHERARVFEDFVLSHCIAPVRPAKLPVNELINMICYEKGLIKVKELLQCAGMSERAMERNFKHSIGLTCKEFIDVIRFNNVFNELQNHDKKDTWIQVAEKYGYYDQSHFIHDVKRYTSRPPGKLLKEARAFLYGQRVYIAVS